MAFCWNHDAVFLGGEVYFVDADCYARMTRVRLLEENLWSPIRSHTFENFPDGIRPHTTAPLDYLIVTLAQIVRPLSHQPLELAGALISPVLGILTLLFLAFWSQTARIPFRWAMLCLLAVSPIISHGFLLGRPDHQSLILFFIAIALAAEVRMWQGGIGIWPVLSGISWSLALWTSLFEPLILLSAVLAARLVRCVSTRPFSPFIPLQNRKISWGIFCGILAFAWIWDGLPIAKPDPHFGQWILNIGEVQHGTLGLIFSWCGWLLVLAPILLAMHFIQRRDSLSLAWVWLLLLMLSLTFLHARWGYFLVLVLAMGLPLALPVLRWRALTWGLCFISLWPIATEWERVLYPDPYAARARSENIMDAVALRDAAMRLKDLPREGVIAPWWFSPAIAWWSGQSCIAGSSHESLPGIVDSAEFYLATDFSTAQQILERRKVGYVIAYDPARVISNAAQILGRQSPKGSLGETLYNHPNAHWNDLQPLYANQFFKVFAVKKSPYFGNAVP